MTLYHYGSSRFAILYGIKQPPCDTDHKPGGLWLSKDTRDGWSRLHVADTTYKTEFTIKPSACNEILTIRSEQELHSFVQRYGESSQRKCSIVDLTLNNFRDQCVSNCQGQCFNCFGLHIIWGRVKSEYKGIAITPYQRNLSHRCGDPKFHWYRFDCASWCVWNTSCLEKVGGSVRTTTP